MSRTTRILLAVVFVTAFICGVTDFGTSISWYAAAVVATIAVFAAAMLWHAKRHSEGA